MTAAEKQDIVRRGVEGVMAMAEAIRQLGSVPAGTLYAHVCGACDIEQFQAVIDILKRAGLVDEKNHMLTWIGPQVTP